MPERNQTMLKSNRARHLTLRKWEERLVKAFFLSAALLSVVTTIAIVAVLLNDSLSFFGEVSLWRFLTETQWDPPVHFGVLPLINGTLMVAAIAAIVALVLGLGSAIFLAEYAPERLRKALKPVLEILAGIPTVVYGYFALTFISPLLRSVFGIEIIPLFNPLSAGIAMGLLITPLVSTLAEDAMLSVPRSLRYSAYALGATKLEVTFRVVIPAALSGIIAAFILAISRAVGETLIVTIAAGLQTSIVPNPLQSAQPITSAIVRTIGGEAPRGSVEYEAIFALGLVLFIMTLALNLLGHWIVRKFRLRYE